MTIDYREHWHYEYERALDDGSPREQAEQIADDYVDKQYPDCLLFHVSDVIRMHQNANVDD